MFNFFKKKKESVKKVSANFEIELTASILAYEIARSDGNISEPELSLLYDEIKKISDKVNKEEDRIPFDLEYFNKITKGGVPSKTLNIALAGTGVGKSLFMCHVASGALVEGRNVLYITMEMAEERIAERIDANLLNTPIDQLPNLSKDMFTTKVQDLARKTTGKLIVKEYPTGSAHSGHFRALLNELKLKKEFVPDFTSRG